MNIEDILPVLVPGVLIQIGVQAYYIKHCWVNGALNTRRKAVYIILIALFNLPAAAAYMFFNARDKGSFKSRDIGGMHIDSGTRQGVFLLLVTALEILSFNIIFSGQTDNISLVTALLGAVFILQIFGGLFIRPRRKFLYYVIPAVKILLAIAVYYLDYSMSSQFIVLIAVASVINDLSLNESKVYSLCAFILYTVSCIVKIIGMGEVDENSIIGGLYVNLIIFMLVFISFYTLKKQMLLNRLLGGALQELKEKSLKLEQMGAIAERNRIASQIHDNVGHKLTAAMISIDAGEKMIEKDMAEAKEKLSLAREQIKDGLSSIRLSVKAIKQGEQKRFSQRLSELLSQIKKDTGLSINDITEITAELLPIQQNVLLQAVTECATNSIKHGKARQLDILIQEHKGAVSMTVSDDGQGAPEIKPGFGLTNMRERVEGIGGTFVTQSGAGDGFTVSITIPAGGGGKA